MKSDSFFRVFAAALILLAAPAVRAQDAVSMKIDVVSWGSDINGLSFKAAGKGEPITALAFRYSKPVSYSGPAILEIHQEAAAASSATADSKNTAPLPPELAKRRETDPTVVALAKLPVGSKRATVLIAPAQAGTYQTFVIDDDPTKLPFGKLRVHNYSPIKIAVRCNGKESMEMKTRDSFLAEPQEGQVTYELSYDKQGKWKLQENNIVTVGKDEQVQFIVLKSDADFFTSSDGSRGGFLQSVVLRRPAKDDAAP
jgi:hypothetical protein